MFTPSLVEYIDFDKEIAAYDKYIDQNDPKISNIVTKVNNILTNNSYDNGIPKAMKEVVAWAKKMDIEFDDITIEINDSQKSKYSALYKIYKKTKGVNSNNKCSKTAANLLIGFLSLKYMKILAKSTNFGTLDDIQGFHEIIKNHINDSTKKLEETERKITEKLEETERKITKKQAETDTKIDQLTKKLAETDTKIDQLTKKQAETDTKIDQLTKKLAETDRKITKKFAETDTKIDQLATKLAETDIKIQKILDIVNTNNNKKTNDENQNPNNRFKKLEEKVEMIIGTIKNTKDFMVNEYGIDFFAGTHR